MTLKKSSIDTFLIACCLVSTIMPVIFAKKMVIMVFCFLLIKFLVNRNKFHYINVKIMIFLLFLPGMTMAFSHSGEALFRYFPVLFLIFGFPFSNYQLNYFFLFKTLIFIILYLILSQLLITYGNDFLIQFRINWYPFEWIDKFDISPINSFSEIYFREKSVYRYGGLFYNPNTLAGLVFIYFLIFDILYNHIKKISYQTNFKWIYFVIISLIIISLLLAYSRTILITFILYLLFKNFNKIFFKLKIRFFVLIEIIVSLIILALIFESTILRILNPRDSFSFKYMAFKNYIEDSSILNLLIGGNNDTFLDQEYGYWLSTSGLIGLLAFFIFFKMMINTVKTTKILIFSFLLIGIGATVFYNFIMISVIIPLLIINSSIYFNTKMKIKI